MMTKILPAKTYRKFRYASFEDPDYLSVTAKDFKKEVSAINPFLFICNKPLLQQFTSVTAQLDWKLSPIYPKWTIIMV